MNLALVGRSRGFLLLLQAFQCLYTCHRENDIPNPAVGFSRAASAIRKRRAVLPCTLR